MILLPLNDSTAASPNEPAGRPFVGGAEATRRRRTRSRRAVRERDAPGSRRSRRTCRACPPARSPGRVGPAPAAASSACSSRRGVDVAGLRSQSTKCGSAPTYRIALTVAAKVRVDTGTTSPGPTPQRHQGQVQGSRCQTTGHRVGRTDAFGDLGLERREVGAGRGHPAGLHGSDDVLLLQLADVRGQTAGPFRGRWMTLHFPRW